MNTIRRSVVMLFALFALAACGGGGGGASPSSGTTCTWDSSTWDNCAFGS